MSAHAVRYSAGVRIGLAHAGPENDAQNPADGVLARADHAAGARCITTARCSGAGLARNAEPVCTTSAVGDAVTRSVTRSGGTRFV